MSQALFCLISSCYILSIISAVCILLALFSDFWECDEYDIDRVQRLARQTYNDTEVKVIGSRYIVVHRFETVTPAHELDGGGNATTAGRQRRLIIPDIYLFMTCGGIWRVCNMLTGSERQEILTETNNHRQGLSARCFSYITDKERIRRFEIQDKASDVDWLLRLQNSAISSAMVCILLLSSSLLTSVVGICLKQVSALMVTGVMFILTGVFGLFVLAVMHYKMKLEEEHSMTLFTDTPDIFLPTRGLQTSWSMSLCWGAIPLAALSSALWMAVSNIMRHMLMTAN